MSSNTVTLVCIVINYNRADMLKTCIESLLKQKTKYKFTILIVDDHSSDNTAEVVRDLQEENSDKDIFFFSTEKNYGLGKAALVALEPKMKLHLKADYLYRIDSDDYLIDSKKFEKQINFLESNPDSVGTCHHYKTIDEINNKEFISSDVITGIYSSSELIDLMNTKLTYCQTSTYMYRNIHKSVSPPAFKHKWARGDVLYNWAMLRHGKINYTDDVMSVYRHHDKGVWISLSESKKKSENLFLFFKIFLMLSSSDKIIFLKARVRLFVYKTKMKYRKV